MTAFSFSFSTRAAWIACLLASGSVRSPDHDLGGEAAFGEWGAALARLDDLDGDGGDELAVGAPGAGGDAGLVRLLSGAQGTERLELAGHAPRDRFGAALALGADLDGDGVGDLLIGAPQRPPPVSWNASFVPGGASGDGYVEIRSTRTGALLRSHAPAQHGEAFGFALASGADVDGDSVPDYLAGAPAPANGVLLEPGDVWLYSGASGLPIRHHAGSAAVGIGGFGYSLTFLADQDGDGVAEYAVGSPGQGAYASAAIGRITLFGGASGAVLWSVQIGGDAGKGLGWGLAACGDADGDGHEDLVASATGVLHEGYANWLSGSNGSLLFSVGGFTIDAGEGAGAASLVGLGSHSRPGVAFAAQQGYTVHAWSAEGFEVLATHTHSAAGFGEAIAGGDFDGDGRLDLAVGAPAADARARKAGLVAVFLDAFP